jgi:hypothetical protein
VLLITNKVNENGDWLTMLSQGMKDGRALFSTAIPPDQKRNPFCIYLEDAMYIQTIEQLETLLAKAFDAWEAHMLLHYHDIKEQIGSHMHLHVQLEQHSDLMDSLLVLSKEALGFKIVSSLMALVEKGVKKVQEEMKISETVIEPVTVALRELFAGIQGVVKEMGQPTLDDDVYEVVPTFFENLLSEMSQVEDGAKLCQIRLAHDLGDGQLVPILKAYPLAPNSEQFQNEMQSICQDYSIHLLQRFIVLKSNLFVESLKCHLESNTWMAMAHPKTVSKYWTNQVALLLEFNALACRYFPERDNSSTDSTGTLDSKRSTGPGHHRSTSSISSITGPVNGTHHHYSSSSGSFNRRGSALGMTPNEKAQFIGINKLFADRIQYFGPLLEQDRSSVTSAILRIFLRAWVEFIRCQTLSKFGFQQTLLDAEYCRQKLKSITRDRHCNDLIDEVVTSSYRRCVEPIFLSREVCCV